MTREFIRLLKFEKCWLGLGLDEDNIRELEIELCIQPDKKEIIEGTGGLRKLRWSLQNKGKSGGARVLYVDFITYEKIYLISAYAKNEKVNLTREERNNVKKLIAKLKETLKGGE